MLFLSEGCISVLISKYSSERCTAGISVDFPNLFSFFSSSAPAAPFTNAAVFGIEGNLMELCHPVSHTQVQSGCPSLFLKK